MTASETARADINARCDAWWTCRVKLPLVREDSDRAVLLRAAEIIETRRKFPNVGGDEARIMAAKLKWFAGRMEG